MVTPANNSTRVYTSEDRAYFRGKCLAHRYFDDAQSSVNNVLGVKIAEIVSTPLLFCVDKTASCSKASFCYSDSTNDSIDKCASVSKNVSITACFVPANSLGVVSKLFLEFIRAFKGVKVVESWGGITKITLRKGWNS